MSTSYPATALSIAHHFADIPHEQAHGCNWGTAADNSFWSVNDETYINGCLLTIDLDFIMGYLLECVDRTEGTVSYIAMVVYHGKHPIKGWNLDCQQYEPACGTFFDRTEAADYPTVCQWAVGWIFSAVELHNEERAT